MNKNAKISIPGYNYEETRENPWVKNFPVKIDLNPDNTLAGFSQVITPSAFRHRELMNYHHGNTLQRAH